MCDAHNAHSLVVLLPNGKKRKKTIFFKLFTIIVFIYNLSGVVTKRFTAGCSVYVTNLDLIWFERFDSECKSVNESKSTSEHVNPAS